MCGAPEILYGATLEPMLRKSCFLNETLLFEACRKTCEPQRILFYVGAHVLELKNRVRWFNSYKVSVHYEGL